jgi:hypothetical protein
MSRFSRALKVGAIIAATIIGAQVNASGAAARANNANPVVILPAWRDYAQNVVLRLRDWLAADKQVQRLRIDEHISADITALVWISGDGKVARLTTHNLGVKTTQVIVRAVEGRDIGELPPIDMPQPLRLRFAFKRGSQQ